MRAVAKSEFFDVPILQSMGLSSIERAFPEDRATTGGSGAYGRLQEASMGKDTTIGHWEMAGIISEKPLPVFPNGFPQELLDDFARKTGRGVLCNLPYSGTKVIADYGREHEATGKLIVYTSADSVFQIAAHEEVVPIDELYRDCEIARQLLVGDYGVGRVIARPFVGKYPDYERTSNRHDFSLLPPRKTVLNLIMDKGLTVYGIGKINDIFAGSGITKTVRTQNNEDGMDHLLVAMDEVENGLIYVNLVDFDMQYGHRNDVDGYAAALTAFDRRLPGLVEKMKADDMLVITADHGCDPSTESTDHSREDVPVILYGKKIASGVNIGTRKTFADLGATVGAYLHVETKDIDGQSFQQIIEKME